MRAVEMICSSQFFSFFHEILSPRVVSVYQGRAPRLEPPRSANLSKVPSPVIVTSQTSALMLDLSISQLSGCVGEAIINFRRKPSSDPNAFIIILSEYRERQHHTAFHNSTRTHLTQ
ncbi:hypothetical protein ABKN59_006633 [Abortiporus biennis]